MAFVLATPSRVAKARATEGHEVSVATTCNAGGTITAFQLAVMGWRA